MVVAPGTYRITNSQSGTRFDLSWSEEGNRPIHGWKSHGYDNQRWIVQRSNDLFFLKSAASNLYAHVSADTIGRPLHGSTEPTRWQLQAIGSEHYIIYPNSSLVAELNGGKADNGTPIQLRSKNGEARQKWVFEKVD